MKRILWLGIIFNLLLLGYFKYVDFFINNVNIIFHVDMSLLQLTLPLAISFFTFQQIAYLVDSYKGITKGYDFLDYANFVTFFPQLIAGPIVHHKEMMPQFKDKKNSLINYNNIALGIFIFSIGIFKKVMIADTFAIWATTGFDHTVTLNMLEAWVTSLSYTFQLYFDFSGYTDMAIGVALLFNIRLPINFDSPYKAVSIQDFWKRWHITLSRFLKEYIYIPLGGNKKGKWLTYRNLMLTFLLGGIWHGAGWTFLFWGALHGIAIIIHRIWKEFGYVLPQVIAWFITFNFINITWVFFRAKEWHDAMKVLHGMFLGSLVFPKVWQPYIEIIFKDNVQFGTGLEVYTIYAICIALVISLFFKNTDLLAKAFKPTRLNMLFSALLFLLSLASLSNISEFLYFNF